MNLRPYQTAAVDSVLDYFETGAPGHPLIVAPTGAGKSLIIAALIQRVLASYPTARVMMLTHVKELIQQNADKLLHVWPDAPVGIYSAGLKQADTESPILFCGIQSVWNKAKALASETHPIELVFIDEAHRVPLHTTGTYRRLIRDLLKLNPYLRLIGLTATPYRHVAATKTHTSGYQSLVKGDDRLFTDITYDISKDLVKLIQQDFLAALWPRPTAYRVDLKGVKIENGDYKADQLNALMEREDVIDAILDEALPLAQADDRKHWLVFCSGVDAARFTAANLIARGVSAAVVAGDTSARDREHFIHEFRTGRLTALVSVGVLTTGFDAPVTDCLIIARPTLSPVLYVQMMGRGMRPTEAKISLEGDRKRGCLVLDFCSNVDRHGAIDRLILKEPGPKKGVQLKICPGCEAEISVFANPCPVCGHEFPQDEPEPVPPPKAGTAAIIAGITPIAPPVRYEISRVSYSKHIGKSGIFTLKVDYFSGFLRVASEWVCLEHQPGSYPAQKASVWWRTREPRRLVGIPLSVQQAIDWIDGGFKLKQPTALHIRPPVSRDGFPEIVRYEWPTTNESLNLTCSPNP